MTSNSQNEFISVINRNIKPGHEKDYDDWLQRYLTLERKAHGYRGATIIIPGGPSSALKVYYYPLYRQTLDEGMGRFARIAKVIR